MLTTLVGILGIEASCLLVRRHRGVEKSGVAAGMDQPGEVLGIDRAPRPLQQAAHRVHRAPGVALELRVVLVQDRQVGIERLGPLEGALGLAGTAGVVEVLAEHPLAAAESRPGRRELRVERHALLVDVARLGEVIPVARQLVGAQIQLVDAWAARHVAPDRAAVGLAERLRQRADDPRHQLVLHREHVLQRMLRRVRPHDGAGRCFDQLRGRAKLAAGAKNGAHQRHVHVGVGGELAQVGRLRVEAGRGGAGAHEQVAGAGQRRRDRIGQAEGQEVGLGIGAQHAERQGDEPGHRARRRRRQLRRIASRDHLADGRGHQRRRVVAVGGLLLQRLVDDPVEPGHRGAARERRRLLVQHGVQHVDHRRAAERHPARQHLEEHRGQGEEIGAGVERLAAHLLWRHVVRRADDGAGLGEARRGVRARPPAIGRARPKSSSLTPCGVRNRFDGFRSRWISPRACRASRASRICRAMVEVSAGDSGPRARRAPSDSPASSSIARNRPSSVSSTS